MQRKVPTVNPVSLFSDAAKAEQSKPSVKVPSDSRVNTALDSQSQVFEKNFRLSITSAFNILIPSEGMEFWRYFAGELYKKHKLGMFVHNTYYCGSFLDRDKYVQLLSCHPFSVTLEQLAQAMITTNVNGLKETGELLMSRLTPAVAPSETNKPGF